MKPSAKAKTKLRSNHRESKCPLCVAVCRVPYRSERVGWPPRYVCEHYVGEGDAVTYFREVSDVLILR